MNGLPEPLTPAECDLRGMPFMPVDLVRLFDSDIYALSTGDEFKAAFTLWGKAFLQVPAGSLPTDDRILAHLSGTGARWARVKAMALRGWIECSDGRLYHPVVAEKAREAWTARLGQRARTEAARAARAAKRQDSDSGNTPPVTTSVTENVTTSVTDTVTGSKGQGQGQLSKKERDTSLRSVSLPRARRAVSASLTHFADFWQAYPRKVGRGAAEKAFSAAIAKGASAADIAAGLNRQTWPEDPRFVPHPATWLNQARWQDDPDAAAPPPATADPPGKMDWLWRDMRAEAEAAEFPDFAKGSLQ
jgi:hypothetical protein